MSVFKSASSILSRIEEIERQKQAEIRELLEPARRRLSEIDQERANLDQEERQLLELLGEKRGVAATEKRTRRSRGKRTTAQHKKEIVGKFITDGHIRDNGDLNRELRAALSDAGFGIHDFRKIGEYLPAGWEAKSNGLRGIAAKTVFHKSR